MPSTGLVVSGGIEETEDDWPILAFPPFGVFLILRAARRTRGAYLPHVFTRGQVASGSRTRVRELDRADRKPRESSIRVVGLRKRTGSAQVEGLRV